MLQTDWFWKLFQTAEVSYLNQLCLCVFAVNGEEAHKMKSDTRNKMSDQLRELHPEANHRAVFTGVYWSSASLVQSRRSHVHQLPCFWPITVLSRQGFSVSSASDWSVPLICAVSHQDLNYVTGRSDGCLIFHWGKKGEKARRKRNICLR